MRLRHALPFLLLAALPGCGPEQAPRPPNVVLVSLDTVRADHLSLYGYGKPTSPALDAFAARADVYEKAWSTAPWTVPSHASMFTGLYPFEHRAVSFGEERRGNVRPLPEAHVTLAEFLHESGYRTGAFVANRAFLTPRFQFDQGFGTYVVESVPGVELNARAEAWLRAAPGEPFFLFLNYMDAHRPYNTRPVPHLPAPPAGDPARLLDRLADQVMGSDGPVEPGLVDLVVAQYDTGIANADRAFGALTDALQALGVLERALVVVTSDHGEYFGEHRIVEHSKDVYEPALRVPLVVKRPGQGAGQRIGEPISIADIPGLVLAELPHGTVEPPAPFRVPVGSRPIVAENHFTRAKDLARPWGRRFWRVRTVLYEWPHKYIRSSDGEDELYELTTDPGESRDLRASEKARAERMRETLDRLAPTESAEGPPEPELEMTPEELEALRELGYID